MTTRRLTIEILIDSRRADEALRKLKTDVEGFGGTVTQKGTGAVTGFEKSLLSLGKGAAIAAVGVVSVATAIGLARRAIDLAIGGIIQASLEFASFDQAIGNVGAISGATREELAALSDEALRLAKATRFSPEQTAGALYSLASAGQAAKEQIASLPAVLNFAEAAQADLGKATELIVSGIKGFGLAATDSARVADVFTAAIGASAFNADRLQLAMRNAGPSAAAFGQSLEGTVAASAALVNVMLSGERAGTGLRAVFTELSDKGGKLGIAVRDAEGGFRPLVDIIRDMEAAGWNASRAVRDFGAEAGPALAVLLDGGSGALEGLEARLQSSGQAADVAREQLDRLQGDIDQFTSAQDEAWKVFGMQLEDGSRLLVQTMTAGLSELTVLVRENGEAISRAWLITVQTMIGTAEAFGLAIARIIDQFIAIGDAVGGVSRLLPPAIRDLALFSVLLHEQVVSLSDAPGPAEARFRAFFDTLKEGANASAAALAGLEAATPTVAAGVAASLRNMGFDPETLRSLEEVNEELAELHQKSGLDLAVAIRELGIEITNLRDLDQLTRINDELERMARVTGPELAASLAALGIVVTNLADLDQLNAVIMLLDKMLADQAARPSVGSLGADEKLKEKIDDLAAKLAQATRQEEFLLAALGRGEQEFRRAERVVAAYNAVLIDGVAQLGLFDEALKLEGLRTMRDNLNRLADNMKTLAENTAEAEQAYRDFVADGPTSIDRPELTPRAAGERLDPWVIPVEFDIPAPAEADFEEFRRGYGRAMAEILEEEWAARVEAVSRRAWENVQDIAADAISDIIKTGEVDFKSLADSILDIFANMLAELLVQWAINAAKRIILERAVAAAGGASSSGSKPSGDWLKSGSDAASAANNAGAAWGSIAAVGAVVAIVGAVGLAMGWWGHTGPTRGQASFGGEGDLSITGATGRNAGVITKHIREAFKILEDFLNDVDLEIARFNEVIVRKVNDLYMIEGLPWGALRGATAQEIDEAIAVMSIRTAEFGKSVSEFLAAVIHGSEAITMEQLNAEIELARMVESFGKLDVQIDLQSMTREMDRIFAAISGLLKENLEQLGVGLTNVVNEELSRWQQTFNELTGKELSREEQLDLLKAKGAIFNAEKALRVADLQARLANLKAEEQLVNTRLKLGLGELQGKGRLLNLELGLQGAYLNASKEILDAGMTALGLQIQAIEALINGLKLIPDIDLSKIKLPGGGGVNQAAQDMERLQAMLDAMATLGMSEVAAAIHAVNEKWDEAAKLARGNADALADVAAAREAEINAIRNQVRQDYYDTIAAAQGLSEIWGIKDRFRDLTQAMLDAGLSAEELAERMAGLKWAEDVELQKVEFGIVDRLFGYLSENEAFEKQSLDFARMKVELEFGIMKAQLELLGVFGKYAEIFDAALKAALDALDDVDLSPPPTIRRDFADAARDAERIAESFMRAKQSVAEFLNEMLVGTFGGVNPVGGVDEARRQLDEVIRQAITGNIGAIESFDDYGSTLLRLARDAYGSSPEFQAIYDYVLAAGRDVLSVKTGREGNLIFDERFYSGMQQQVDLQAQMVALLGRIETQLATSRGTQPIARAGVNR